MRFELDRLRAALVLRGHPERGQRFVHVTGTNGKGSVSAMIASALSACGLRTGLYTSPHLHRFVERIRIDGRPVAEALVGRRVARLVAELARTGAPELSFFETATILAFEIFRDLHCDVAVLEVGLGGRLDATNVVVPELSVITRIALEHTGILGPTVSAIAGEKAGIIKHGVPFVTSARDPEARAVIREHARRRRARGWWIDRDYSYATQRGGRLVDVVVRGRRFDGLRLGLRGLYQQENAACAVAALVALRERGLVIPDAAIAKGLRTVRWPGRLERIATRPRVLVDAAHNPDGCVALASELARGPRPSPRVLLFGAMGDKDHRAMLAAFDGLVDRYVFTTPSMRRAADARDLRRIRRGRVVPRVPAALRHALRVTGEDGELVIAGSIFLIAEARAALLDLRTEPLIAM